MSKTCLITGGAGFIGSNFVHQWLAEEATPVVNVDALTYAGNLVSFESGMNKTVQWYLDHRDWIHAVSQGKYQHERLGIAQTLHFYNSQRVD